MSKVSIESIQVHRLRTDGERAEQIPRIGDVIRGIYSAMVYVGGDSLTQGIKSMSFHHFFQHKKQLTGPAVGTEMVFHERTPNV